MIESWCLGYAWSSFTGALDLGKDPAAYSAHFAAFTGLKADGAVLGGGPFLFFVGVFILNFVIIYRGLSKGIEFICNWGMPLLIAIAWCFSFAS